MKEPTTLLCVRHGETNDNVEGVFQGQSGRGLNALGRAQVERLRGRIAALAIDAVYTSDLERALETATILAGSRQIVEDRALREIHVGEWTGLSYGEVEARFPKEWAAWRAGEDVRRGTGETYLDLAVRVRGALERLAGRHPGELVLVVSHGAALKSAVASLLGGEEARRSLGPLGNSSVTTITGRPSSLRVVGWNDTAHLGDPLERLHLP